MYHLQWIGCHRASCHLLKLRFIHVIIIFGVSMIFTVKIHITLLLQQACCIMFDEKPKMVDDPAKMGKKVPNYWDAAKRLLADPSRFLESLITFDKDNIKDAIIQRIQPYIDMEEFTPEAVARVCLLICPSCAACKQKWGSYICMYIMCCSSSAPAQHWLLVP